MSSKQELGSLFEDRRSLGSDSVAAADHATPIVDALYGASLELDEAVYELPASSAQAGFVRLDRLDPGNPAYNVAVRLELHGVVDRALLERSLNLLVSRHEPLRTVFLRRTNFLAQVVRPGLRLQVPLDDLSTLPPADRDELENRISSQEAERRFDLQKGPLLSVRLVRTGKDTSILLMNAHRSVCDASSIQKLLAEMAEIYSALLKSAPISLPELPVQYADYAVWQSNWARGIEAENDLQYWSRQLVGLPSVEIPADFPRQEGQSNESDLQSCVLPGSLMQGLQRLGLEPGLSIFDTALPGLAVLLAAYSHQNEISISTEVAGRHHAEVEHLIGPLANPLVFRCRIDGDPTFLELARRLREITFGALAHQGLPHELVLQKLKAQEHGYYSAAPSVSFVHHDFTQPPEFGEVRSSALPPKPHGTAYELSFSLTEASDLWQLSCEYDKNLFTAKTINHLLDEYKRLIEQVVDDPNRRVSELAIPRAHSRPDAHTEAELVTASERADKEPSNRRVPDSIERCLLEIWGSVLNVPDITVTDDFFALGGHSLMLGGVFRAIKQKLGKDLPLATLFDASTIEKLALVLRQDESKLAWSSLVPIRTTGAKAPLFLIHPIGGHVFIYRDLAKYIDEERPIYALQSFGLRRPEESHKTVEEMASHYIQYVKGVQPNGPYLFGGYSAGGVIAFEMAKQIRATGGDVRLLALLDTSALSDQGSHSSGQAFPKALAVMVKGLSIIYENYRIFAGFGVKRYLQTRKDNVRRRVRIARLRLQRSEPQLKPSAEEAFIIALERYRPTPYEGSAVLIRTQNSPFEQSRQDRGWRDLINGDLVIFEIRGDHYVIFEERYLESTARELNRALNLEWSGPQN